ncbi:MAG: molecular chaperone DnaJ [Gemmatimonadales bacterium]|nr:MAG: molecular chaperone DnaJ [Gemmatimonadales bacterium]
MVNERPFVDYYETLHLSQNADAETVERVYRMLAKRYHPDNKTSGDADLFRDVQEAYETLLDPERRAEFDVKYDSNRTMQWKIFEQGAAIGGREEDQRIFHGVLSLLYVARRKNPDSGGLGVIHLEKMLGVPREHLEFPMWYLKKSGWIEILDTGERAITIDGIDKLSTKEMTIADNRLLRRSPGAEGPGAETTEE